jgi:hypothetical protein
MYIFVYLFFVSHQCKFQLRIVLCMTAVCGYFLFTAINEVFTFSGEEYQPCHFTLCKFRKTFMAV